jgi:two-component system, cell cycle sensor histidine kinase and response regulator CckA
MKLPELKKEFEVVLKYALFGILWIILSDQLIYYIARPFHPGLLNWLQTVKGWLFVSVTALLLYVILKKDVGRIRDSEHSLSELNAIVNASPMVVCLWRNAPGFPVQAISENAMQVFGYPAGRFLSGEIKYADIVHPDDLPEISEEILEFIRSEQPATLPQRYRIITQDGTVKWMEDKTTVRRNAQGKISHFQGVVFDITEKKLAEEKLQRQNELLQTIMDHIPLQVVFIAADGTLQWVNRAWEEVIGWPLEQSRPLELMQQMFPESELRRRVGDFVLNSSGVWQVFETRTREGALLEISWISAALSDETKIVFGQDLSGFKKEEKRRRELEEQLRHSQKLEAVGRLAGGVAHDFNNLLSVIIGYTEILKKRLPSGTHDDCLDHTMQAAERAKNLTRQLLAFGRKQMLEIKSLDINEVIRSFEKLIRRVIGEDIRVHLNLARQACHVKADISQMEQILMNLVVNARDAMPDGGTLTIATAPEHLGEHDNAGKPELIQGDYIMISISDTGRGMDREVLGHIFEPFFTTKDTQSGSGLGLSTVYGIVKQHKGHITVHSEPNRGSTFKIYLPLPREATMPGNIQVTRELNEPALKSSTVLVVEDNEAVRDVICTLLDGNGMQVLSAADGNAAVETARRHNTSIDLLLTDVVMPGMKGPEVHQALVQDHPGIKVLYMSGYTEDIIFSEGVLQEGIHFIQKPFPLKALVEKLNDIFRAG